MQFKDREKKILERINNFKKPVRAVIKGVSPSPKQKVKAQTSAQAKRVMMLSILNNKKLKSSEKLKRVYKMIGNEY